MIEGNDGGANVTFNGRRVLVNDHEPADGAVLPRGHRRSDSLLDLRRAAGQLDGGDRKPQRAASGSRSPTGTTSAVARAAGSRRSPATQTSSTPAATADRSRGSTSGRASSARLIAVAAARHRAGGERPEVPLPVERTDRLVVARPERRVHGGSGPARDHERGAELAGDQSRPHAQRREQADVVGRRDHEGQHRHRGLRHDLHDRRVAARGGNDLGRDGRRARPTDAQRRKELGERHAEGLARVDPDQLRRGLADRQGDGVHRRDHVQVRRLPPVYVQNQ